MPKAEWRNAGVLMRLRIRSLETFFFHAEQGEDAVEVLGAVVVDLDAAFFVAVMDGDIGGKVGDELLLHGGDGAVEFAFGRLRGLRGRRAGSSGWRS